MTAIPNLLSLSVIIVAIGPKLEIERKKLKIRQKDGRGK
jgi:hypothetical protein